MLPFSETLEFFKHSRWKSHSRLTKFHNSVVIRFPLSLPQVWAYMLRKGPNVLITFYIVDQYVAQRSCFGHMLNRRDIDRRLFGFQSF